MIKIASIVEKIILQSPFLTEGIADGVINISALARKIQPEVSQSVGREIQPGAIVMAIKRMRFGSLDTSDKLLKNFFRKISDISVRSNLISYNFRNSDTLLEKQARLLDTIRPLSKGFCTFSQGVTETTIIIGEFFENNLKDIFENEHLLNTRYHLSAITLILPVENRSLYGIYYFILKELAYHGINLVELISTSNEFTVIVAKEDLNDSFSILNNLRNR